MREYVATGILLFTQFLTEKRLPTFKTMEQQILTQQQQQSVRAQLIELGYPDSETMLKTARPVFAGIDPVERDGINIFDGKPKDNMFSILLFVDNGEGDYRHFSTRASWEWPSQILYTGINIVAEEYHAERGGIPAPHEIQDQLMVQVGRQDRADEAMMSEPLKSALECLGIPGSTRLVLSGAWEEGVVFLEAVRDVRLHDTEKDIRLRLEIISYLSTNDGSPPFIAEVTVIPSSAKELSKDGPLTPIGELRYHYGYAPIPDIGQIERDVYGLFAKQQQEVTEDLQKARQISRDLGPPENNPNNHNIPRH